MNLAFKSDMVWVSPELDSSSWRHPRGKPMWDFEGGEEWHSLNHSGIFALCEDVLEVEEFDWPDPKYLDFSSTLKNAKEANDAGLAVFGGMWMPFFHVAADFFGMENYFVKMHTHPEVVKAVTDKIVSFYLEANKRCMDEMAEYLDAGFFGNDFGSQLDLLISPSMFEEFIFPSYKKCIDSIKSHDLKVVVHSCGAIDRIIPRLIEMGIDGLHPLQAKAAGMSAEELARKYQGKLVFIGGIDTQDLLPFGSVGEIKAEVRRIKKILGPQVIISPSHEALLSNVAPEKVIAMSEAVRED